MKSEIDQLSDEQAQHALMIFYSSLPETLWGEHNKPQQSELESFAFELQDESYDDAHAFLEKISNRNEDELRGGLSKYILNDLYAIDPLKPLINNAIIKAKEPHMAPIPLVPLFALIAFLAVAPKEINRDDKGNISAKFGHLDDGAKFVNSMTDFVKSLPNSLKGLLKGMQ
ncbi:MAG TPA: hypothetical protein PKV33_05915 [Methanothrix sp.]|nr:hypothetical protein [Methanothrix sp.]